VGPRRIFISYSQETGPGGIPGHREAALELAQQLNERDEFDAVIDQYYEHDPPRWPFWVVEELYKADFVLCLASPGYFRSSQAIKTGGPLTDGTQSVEHGRGASWEVLHITEMLYRDVQLHGTSKRIVSVLLPGCTTEHIPLTLSPIATSHHRFPEEKEALFRRLNGRPRPEAVPRRPGAITRVDEQEFEQPDGARAAHAAD
jgi:hypothetical protein